MGKKKWIGAAIMENSMEASQKKKKKKKERKNYHMTQQFHSYIYIWKKQKHWFKKMHAPQCSKQHCLQLPTYGSNLSIHWQKSG